MLAKRFFWLVIVVFPVLGWSQPADRFQVLIQSAPSEQPLLATSKMNEFIAALRIKRGKLRSDESFLRYAFRESHKTFLKNYKAYSQFPEIFDSGNYDCLSATSFFSVVLDAFSFDYKIIETNYHIFLVVETDQKLVLLEPTDKTYGFISDDRIVKERLHAYRENNLVTRPDSQKHHYQFDLDIYQRVMPDQLTGLLYFNQAVIAFNNKDYSDCAQKIKRAIRIYNNPRIAELIVILVAEVSESDLEEAEKKNIIRPFASFIKAKEAIVAAR